MQASSVKERRYSSNSILISALDGVSGQRHDPAALYPSIHWIGGWEDFKAGLDTEAKGKIRFASVRDRLPVCSRQYTDWTTSAPNAFEHKGEVIQNGDNYKKTFTHSNLNVLILAGLTEDGWHGQDMQNTGKYEKLMYDLIRRPHGKRPDGQWIWCNENIKMDIKQIGCQGVKWIQIVQNII
jgi:hypothetical protein